MHRTRKLFATTMFAAAGAVSAALALGAPAAAQPAPAPAPAPEIPGLPFLQQLAANPAAATQLMQGFANLMGNAPAATATATPATPVSGPGATASIELPQPAAILPAATLPGATLPGATPLGNGNITTVPVANTTVPAAAPVSPLAGLTDQLPGGLASLLPAGNPLASLLPGAATAPATVAPATAPAAAPAIPPAFSPLSALP